MARRRDLHGEIEELFAELWQVPRFASGRQGFRPRIDCFRTDAEITVVVELAGVDPAAVQLDVTARSLVVRGERRRERAPGSVYQALEIDRGPFERLIEFTDAVDVERTSATYRDGLLTVVLPVARAAATSATIPIVVQERS